MKTTKHENKESIIDTLTAAQRFIFAPVAFQALAAMLDLGIIEFLDKKPATESEIISSLKLDEYTVRTLLQSGLMNNIIQENENYYNLTKFGKLFLYNDMTIANFNYIKDVCYLGASELTESFKTHQPKGLHRFIGNYPTIYPALTKLPKQMQQSWYKFDHFYSDNCFEEVFSVITQKYKSIYDIGGNTGKFESLCLKKDKNIDITMLDLKANIDAISCNSKLKNCKFRPINVLDKNPDYPEIKNSAVLMSQFLDCFSKEDILKILTDLRMKMDKNSSLYILEPFTDLQKFEGAEYSLVHTSLYFTCMANGVSKIYSCGEMEELIKKAGFTICNQYQNIGSYDYTLMECKNTRTEQWFQIKEQAAGKKRLQLTWFLYKIFGEKILYVISFIVAFFTFLFAPKIREYSKKYLNITQNQTGIKPNLLNQFKHIHAYADSLADKLLVYSGNYRKSNITLEDNNNIKNQLSEDLEKGNGIFFICNHIGNIEIIQAFFTDSKVKPNFNVNIFMSNKQSQIFNQFLQTIKYNFPFNIFYVEDIGLNTGIELKENLNNGDMVFIAGDRLAQDNDKKYIEAELFSHKIYLPEGTFKLAKLMDVPTYFISAVKIDNRYKIVLERQNSLAETELVSAYTKFMEKVIKYNPLQFFHFYDFFG